MENQNNAQNEKRERALQDVKMFIANDWELAEETPEFFLLKRSKMTLGKHLLVFLFTWWSFGIANLLFHYFAKERKKILK